MKKFLSLALALMLTASLSVGVLADAPAATTTGAYNVETPQSTTITIDAAATQLTATVPTSINIAVDSATDAVVGDAAITNTGSGVIEVKSLTLTDSAYTLEAYSSKAAFMNYDVGSHKLGLSMAFGTTGELTASPVTYVTGTDFVSGTAKNVAAGTLKIAASGAASYTNTLTIHSAALVSPTGATAVEDATAATMVIVLGWFTGNS